MNKAKVDEIREAYLSGIDIPELAEAFGCTEKRAKQVVFNHIYPSKTYGTALKRYQEKKFASDTLVEEVIRKKTNKVEMKREERKRKTKEEREAKRQREAFTKPIRRSYTQGASIRELSESNNLTHQEIREILKEGRDISRDRTLNTRDAREIRKDYLDGVEKDELAKKFSTTRNKVIEVITNKVHPTKKYARELEAFRRAKWNEIRKVRYAPKYEAYNRRVERDAKKGITW